MRVPVKCRLPNSNTYMVVQIGESTFQLQREFPDEVFGYIDGTYVALCREDWEIAKDLWEHDTAAESDIP